MINESSKQVSYFDDIENDKEKLTMTFETNKDGKHVDRCDCCGKELHSFLDYGVMLEDEYWKKVVEHCKIDPHRGLLCYGCMFRTLYKIGIDPFEDGVMRDCPWNDDLYARGFLESEDFEYEYLPSSKRHRLWHFPKDDESETAWMDAFKIDFTSYGDLVKFANYLSNLWLQLTSNTKKK